MERIDCEAASGNPVLNPAPPNTRMQADRLWRARSLRFWHVLMRRACVGG